MVEEKLKLLEQNLLRKSELMDRLYELYDEQSALLEDSDMEPEKFDCCMDKYDEMLQELTVLNNEADELYESLQMEQILEGGPNSTQIGTLKTLISQLMDKANAHQEKEKLVKKQLEFYFDGERKSLGSGRKTSKAALDYYKSMSRSNVIPPQFMDQKK